MLKYVDDFTGWAPPGPALPSYSYTYRAGSVFDPDLSGLGHQPYGRDTLATFYEKYRVRSSYCRITSIPFTAGSFLDHEIWVTCGRDVGHLAGMSQTERLEVVAAHSHLVSRGIPGDNLRRTIWANYRCPNLKDEVYSATVGNNPADGFFFELFVRALDGTTGITGGAVNFRVQLTYVVEFFQPIYVSLAS